MAVATIPAVASPVKSVQRGSAGGSGNVTITAVDIAKSFVNVFGTASSGTVSASFNMSMNAGNTTAIGNMFSRINSGNWYQNRGSIPSAASEVGWSYGTGRQGAWQQTVAVNSGNASVGAGSNNLVAAVVQGFLANSTTLTVSGACRYEVVEFN